MTGQKDFIFAGHRFSARQSGALYWPEEEMLIVSDLHLGRAERYARLGGPLLPPWHDEETLNALQAEIEALAPKTLVSLGDGFDDDGAAREASPELCQRLKTLAEGRDWIWIEGNHDPAPLPPQIPGRKCADLLKEVLLIHEASARNIPQISGHFHPVAPLAGRRWRCFALSEHHLIMPSFGRYTGGLDINSADFQKLMPNGLAICCSASMFVLPFPHPERRAL